MFSGRGGSRNYRIIWEGRGPSLTDALVAIYLLFTECSNLPFQVNLLENFQGGRVGESNILDAMGLGWGEEVVILIPKETYDTCNFQEGGGGGPDLLTPPPTSLWIQKLKESVETINTPKYTVVQQLQVDITNSVMLCSGQKSSITKDDNY